MFSAAAGCPSYSEPGDPCTGAFNALITVAPGGGPARQIARCPGDQCSQALLRTAGWSPDGRLLAAEGPQDQGSSQVAILTPDGALARLVAVPAPEAEPLGWLPGGRRLAVLSGTHVSDPCPWPEARRARARRTVRSGHAALARGWPSPPRALNASSDTTPAVYTWAQTARASP